MNLWVRGLTIVLMCAAVLTAVPSRSVALACQAQNQPLIRLSEDPCSGSATYEILDLEPDAFSGVLPSIMAQTGWFISTIVIFMTILLVPTHLFNARPLSPPPRIV